MPSMLEVSRIAFVLLGNSFSLFNFISRPGTGKTTTLIGRIDFLLKKKIKIEDIQVLTFSKISEKDFKKRLMRIAENKTTKNLSVNTFHSFSLKIIKKYCLLFEKGKRIKIFTRNEKTKEIIIKLAENEIIDNEDFRTENDVVRGIKDAIIKGNSCNEDKVKKARKLINTTIYQTMKKEQLKDGCYEFIDLLQEAINILKMNKNENKLKFLPKYILVDEFQDLNSLQNQILLLIDCVYFVVGDPNQSIYKFRNASYEKNLQELKDKVGNNYLEVFLSQNYRNSTKILKLASKAIPKTRKNARYHPSLLNAANTFDANVEINKLKTKEDEKRNILGWIKKRQFDNPNAVIAVLCRTNKNVLEISKLLKDAGLINNVVNDDDLEENRLEKIEELKIFGDYLTFFQIIQSNHFLCSDGLLLIFFATINYFHGKFGYTSIDGEALKDDIKAQKFSDSHFSRFYGIAKIPSKDRFMDDTECKIFSRILKLIQKLTTVKGGKKLMEIANFYKFQKNTRFKKEQRRMIKFFIESFANFNGDTKTLIDSINNFKFETDHQQNKDKLVVSTIHHSKGSEYDSVVIPFTFPKNFPTVHALFDTEEYAEEERLLFVAMTRSKNHLMLSQSTSDYSNNNENHGDFIGRFLEKQNKQYVHLIENVVDQFEENFEDDFLPDTQQSGFCSAFDLFNTSSIDSESDEERNISSRNEKKRKRSKDKKKDNNTRKRLKIRTGKEILVLTNTK